LSSRQFTVIFFIFRADLLDSVMYRMGLLAVLRSKYKDGSKLILLDSQRLPLNLGKK